MHFTTNTWKKMWSYKRFWLCIQQLASLLSVISSTIFFLQIQLDRWDRQHETDIKFQGVRGLFFESHMFSVRKGWLLLLFYLLVVLNDEERRKSLCTLPVSLLAPKVLLEDLWPMMTIRPSIPSQSVHIYSIEHNFSWTRINVIMMHEDTINDVLLQDPRRKQACANQILQYPE